MTMDTIAPNILRCAEHAAKLEQRTGMRCVIALEPEPRLTVETTAEAIEFFERFVHGRDTQAPRGQLHDLSHQFVEFEDFGASISLLYEHDIPIAKIHVSNAAELIALKPFYEDSIYLHQVCGVDARGERAYFSLDWPTEPPPVNITRFRVHYHLPVCPQPDSPVATALPEIEKFLTSPSLALEPAIPCIIETDTWPEQLRGREALVENLCQELLWVREKISLCVA